MDQLQDLSSDVINTVCFCVLQLTPGSKPQIQFTVKNDKEKK